MYLYTVQLSADSEEGYNLAQALQACQSVYDNVDDNNQFLCIPFISDQFDDTFEALEVTANPDFANIYLSFIVYDEDSALYATLGSFGMLFNIQMIYNFYIYIDIYITYIF